MALRGSPRNPRYRGGRPLTIFVLLKRMRPSLVRFPMLVLVALCLVPGGAHVLELPVKMHYSPELYAAVTSTLYALFGSIGAVIQVAAVLCAAWMSYLVRKTPAFRIMNRPGFFGDFRV